MDVGRDGYDGTPLAEMDLTPWIRDTVGTRLAHVLRGRAMSRRELARISGVSEACLSRILSCQRVVNPDALVRICITLGVSSDWLLGLRESPRPARGSLGADGSGRPRG